jgi:4-amino-4-deoxy-L-arabinose transferase-like glycosyltransferase
MQFESVLKNSLLVFLFSAIVFLTGTGKSSIYILDESKNAECAWEMMRSDDHITPVFNGVLRTDKPPLHYYFMMAGYSLMGKNAFAARFFSSVSGSVLMVLLYLFVCTYAGRAVAFWSILTLLSSVLWVTEFHLAVPDPYLILFTASGLMAFYHFTQKNVKWSLILMYACFSLGFMTKGPVAVVLPGAAIIIFLFVTKQFNWVTIKKLRPLAGLVIFLVIAAPWYLLVWKTTDGEWIKGFFLDHNIRRFANVREGHGGIFLLTLVYYALGLLPFFAFIGGISRYVWRRRESPFIAFSTIIVLVYIVFFSISRTKLPNYAMPSFPFMAVLTGSYLSEISGGRLNERLNLKIGLWILLAISISIPIALTYGVVLEPLLSHLKNLGLYFVFLPVGIIISLYLVNKEYSRQALLTVSLTFILASFVFVSFLFPKIVSYNPVASNLELLEKANTVKFYRTINPSFIFNYGIIEEIKDTNQVKTFLEKGGNLLITSQKALKETTSFWSGYAVVYSGKDLFDLNHTIILSGGK